MSVVRRYAAHLAAQDGWEAALIVTGRDTDGLPASEGDIRVIALDGAAGDWDVLVATWWTTTEALWALPAARRVLFVQGIEQRFYREQDWADRLAAMTVLDLPVDYIVVSEYMVELLRVLRPDAEVALVPNGIDKETFSPGGTSADPQPLRVLVEGQPTLWFKGIDAAVRSVRRMEQPATVTLAAHDRADAEGAPLEAAPDRIVSEQTAAGMAELYREHDVLLKLSRFEGFGLPVLEALHAGTPVVTTPYTGHDTLVRDGENGLVVDFDDEAGTAAALDLLASDRERLARLAAGAAESVSDWPSAGETARRFQAALEHLLELEPKSPVAALDNLMKRRRTATVLAREAFRREVRKAQSYRHEYEQMRKSAAHERSVAEERLETLQSIRAERAYRTAVAVRRVMRSVWPRR